MTWSGLKSLKRALKHFRSGSQMLPTDRDMDQLVSRRGQGALLLDFYSPADVLEALDRYSVAPRIADRGYSDLEVELQTGERIRQVVRVTGRKDDDRHLLGEAVLRHDDFRTDASFAGPLQDRKLRMLFVQWIRLQDPTRGFGAHRPPLPGQLHPGLGVGREVMSMFLGLADRLGFDGIMVCPEFAHNAVLYSRQFRFFDPDTQGRYEALAETMVGLTLAQFAWGVEKGCVTDENTGEKLRWFQEEMLRATGGVVIQYLRSRDYARRVVQARSRYRYQLDVQELEAMGLPPAEPPG